MTLPATAPTMISIRATEIAAQIDIRDAASARPIHSADASQTLSMAILFPALPQQADEPTERGHGHVTAWRKRDSPSAATDLPPLLHGRSHQPHRRFWGTPSPFDTVDLNAAAVTCKGRRGPLLQLARQNTASSGRLAAGEEFAHAIERLEDVLGRVGIGEPHVALAENAEVRPPDNRNTCILQQGRGEGLRLPSGALGVREGVECPFGGDAGNAGQAVQSLDHHL